MNSATLKDPAVKTATPVQPGPAAPAGGMRVAIVEDDLSQAELLSHWLELAGHRCHHFDRGEALIRALDQESFDILVLDWNLPEDDAKRGSENGNSCAEPEMGSLGCRPSIMPR